MSTAQLGLVGDLKGKSGLGLNAGTYWDSNGVLQQLTAGTAGQVWTTQGTGSAPTFTTPSAGGGGTSVAGAMALIAETILTGTAATVNFAAIAQTYRDLRLVVRGRGTQASTIVGVQVQFNGDTSASYDDDYFYHQHTTFNGTNDIAQTSFTIGYVTGSTAPSDVPGGCDCTIYDYARTTFQKVTRSDGWAKAANSAGNIAQQHSTGNWRSTAAITSILVFPGAGSFAAGTVVSLYGVSAEVGAGAGAVHDMIGSAAFSASGGSISGLAVTGIISGVTRTGAGVYSVAFSGAQADANYIASITASDDATAATGVSFSGNSSAYTTTGFAVQVYQVQASPAGRDPQVVRIAVFRYGGVTSPVMPGVKGSAEVSTYETTSSTSFGALTTAGPAVTLTTETDVLVTLCANVGRAAAGTGNTGHASVAVSGASTVAANTVHAASSAGTGNGFGVAASITFKITGLTPGVNTFTMQYKVDGSTFGFANRNITIERLN